MAWSLDITSQFLHPPTEPLADDPPGFQILPPPRKAARGREKDTLAMCLSLRARQPVPPDRYAELLDLATATFFGAPGTVTAALRHTLLAVNQKLLDLNLRDNAPMQGGLLAAVLRNDDKASAGRDFYAAQCGGGALLMAHATSLEKFPAEAGRPLGLNNTPDIHYFHTLVADGEYFCLTPTAATQWNEPTLVGLGQLANLSAVNERLWTVLGNSAPMLIARFEPASAPVSAAPRSGLAALLRARTESAVMPEAPAPAPDPLPPDVEPAPVAGTDWQDLVQRAERFGQADPTPHVPILDSAEAETEADAEPAPTPWHQKLGERVQHYIRSLGRAVSNTLLASNLALRRTTARALPEGTLQKDGLLAIPNSVQLGIAVLMPLLFASIGLGLYWQYGRTQQFDASLREAQLAIAAARQAPDANAARASWEAAMVALERAEGIRFDAEVVSLKQEAQIQLDALDWVTRLTYRPLVVGGLGQKIKITRIALLGLEVFALDANANRIYHLTPSSNNTGYVVDRDFRCGAGRIGQIEIGTVVDMAVIPGPNVTGGDAVMALDLNGNLLYCTPGKEPVGSALPLPPNSGWLPKAFELYTNRLYVLDPVSNQVWQFQETGGSYLQAPASYFVAGAPDLSDVVEFSIASGDVYLLHRDGRVTICSRPNAGEDPLCQNNVPFSDGRPGRTPGDHLADVTAPVRLFYAPPPEPSLYLLDVESAGVYQLSLKLAFVRQFRPQVPFPDSVETMEIDQAKRIFMGAGDNVYVMVNP